MKKILILGGTNFIGRLLTEKLLEIENIDITLFNRGKTNTDLFPQIKKIIGDRETNDIKQINNQDWDIVFDFSCYYPNSLGKMLKEISVKKYIFISTVSVYDTDKQTSINENDKILDCSESEKINTLMYTYGNRKAECERIILSHEFEKTILRPALVYGKYDYTDRFYYWIYHILSQKNIIFPNYAEKSLLNFTFVEDFIKIAIFAAFNEMNDEIYNSVTHQETNLLNIVNIISQKLSKNVGIKTVDNDFLNTNNIKVWSDIALTLPYNLFYDYSKIANEVDFKFNSLNDSIDKTIEYYQSINYPKGKFGISLEKENELISKI